jgi:16S rRNA processing protein RimM
MPFALAEGIALNAMSRGILTTGWLPLAHLLRPQGRHGELLADPLTDLPGLFTPGREVILTPSDVTTPTPGFATLQIEDHFFPTGKNAGRIVLKLSGCNSISEAEALAGQDLLIPTTNLPPLDPDTFFVGDLVGCILLDSSAPGTPIPVGTIVDLEFATTPDGRTRLEDAAPLLAVNPLHRTFNFPQTSAPINPADPILVPFVRAWLDSVDVPGRRITMRLPEGLFQPEELIESPEQST